MVYLGESAMEGKNRVLFKININSDLIDKIYIYGV